MTLPDLLLKLAVHHPGTYSSALLCPPVLKFHMYNDTVSGSRNRAYRSYDIVSTVGRLFYLMTLPDLLLKLAVHRLGTSNHPTKQSDSMTIAVSYPVDAMFTPRHR